METNEYLELRRHAESFRDEVAIRFGGEVGLRSFEIPQIKPKHITREFVGDDDYFFLRVPRGKDTTGGGGKARDAFLPEEFEHQLHRYADSEGIEHDESYVDVSSKTIQRAVKRAAKRAAEETGDEDYLQVTSHDLRRYFGHQVLVEKRMNPRVVMSIGGWKDYDSLKPYLSQPSIETIVDEFERAGMA